jgi:hypothetical protein
VIKRKNVNRFLITTIERDFDFGREFFFNKNKNVNNRKVNNERTIRTTTMKFRKEKKELSF